MDKKPVIGIMPLWDEKRSSIWMYPGYTNGIIRAGGVPLILPYSDNEEVFTQALEMCDGCLITGGQDISPSIYGEEKKFDSVATCQLRDRLETILLDKAIELDKPLAKKHAINSVVLDVKVQNAGYQGDAEPDLLFGGPVLDGSRGNMTLRNGKGLIVDAMNYGGLVDPWLAEGYHGDSGAGAEGAYAPVPQSGRGRGGFGAFGAAPAAPAAGPDLSTGRYPDGFDTDDNKLDFHTGQAMTIAAPVQAGQDNVKVTSVQGLSIGQVMYLGSGSTMEKVRIATIGTAGATTISADAARNETKISVASAQGFQNGQTITIGSDSYVISAIQMTPRRGGWGRPQQPAQPDVITIATGLKESVAAGTYLTGSGITLGAPVTVNHGAGDAFSASVATPGKPNIR